MNQKRFRVKAAAQERAGGRWKNAGWKPATRTEDGWIPGRRPPPFCFAPQGGASHNATRGQAKKLKPRICAPIYCIGASRRRL